MAGVTPAGYMAAQPFGHAAPALLLHVATHATKFGIMADQVGKFAALLHEVAARQSGDAFLEAGYSQNLAQHHSGILEAQGLIEVRGKQIMLACAAGHGVRPS